MEALWKVIEKMPETFQKEIAKEDPRLPPEHQGLGLVGQGIASNYGHRDTQIYGLVVGYRSEHNVHKLYIPATRTTMLVKIEAGAYRLVNIRSLPAWTGCSIIYGQRIYMNNIDKNNGNNNREAYIVNYEKEWKWTVFDPQDDTLTVYDLGRIRKKWEFLDIGVWNINGKALSTWSTSPNA